MRILVVGGGGREHALVWKLKQSPLLQKIYCAPGNPGIAALAECVAIPSGEIEELLFFARKEKIDLTIIGPEAPLVAGIVDLFESNGLSVFGPNKEASQLEGSKIFAKNIMIKYGIPTAGFSYFTSLPEATDYLQGVSFPVVVKADGLAAGKGVTIAETVQEALIALKTIMEDKSFGAAGERVLIEEYLQGEEVSVLAVTDGEDFLIMPAAQDHKPIFEGDRGPNTGGMGAYSPVPVFTEALRQTVKREIFSPLLAGLSAEGISYRGVIYAGLMLTATGPKVLEFNVRFGDPETQVIMPRIASDILPLFSASASGSLKGKQVQFLPECCACVVLASRGYPGKYEKGKIIQGLNQLSAQCNSFVFHAGTAKVDGCIVTDGGRVLGVTVWDLTLQKALRKAYSAIEKITFEGAHYRRDIGRRALEKFS